MIKEPEDLELENAVIERAEIRSGDHGVLTVWLYLTYGGRNQGFGGHCLYAPKSFKYHTLESLAGHFIFRTMEIAGITDWSDLPGKTIRVRHNHSIVWEIGHIINEDWFCPAKDFESVTKENEKEEEADAS
ncbi:MAG: hypothetical protein LBK61_07865 [Spirochaetaceae bacterium]|jgi:hypothetical protein|nr:hypothetical protein [Spirochaetaceae bacterium]